LFRIAVLVSLCLGKVLAQNTPASVSVDANLSRHPINPGIYGFAFGSKSDLTATNFTMNRSGGNSTSTYNWQINATNHDLDWFFESILDPPQTAGYDGDSFITQTRNANVGAQPLLTIPMIGYLANLGPGGAKTLRSPSRRPSRPFPSAPPHSPSPARVWPPLAAPSP
jgi:hypothetical protein